MHRRQRFLGVGGREFGAPACLEVEHMSSSDGHDGHNGFASWLGADEQFGQRDTMLFESLVHVLIEKGVLTKNDALSIVETVAHVTRGQVSESHTSTSESDKELGPLRRLFESFQALRDRSAGADGTNVRQLRPPIHRDVVEFPKSE